MSQNSRPNEIEDVTIRVLNDDGVMIDVEAEIHDFAGNEWVFQYECLNSGTEVTLSGVRFCPAGSKEFVENYDVNSIPDKVARYVEASAPLINFFVKNI